MRLLSVGLIIPHAFEEQQAGFIRFPPHQTVNILNEDVNLNAGAGSVVTSANYYETNSQKISIKLKCSKSIIVKVSLYDIEGNTIGEETKELGGIFNTTWTFRSLSSNKVYFFEVENLGQIDVAITGTVTD